MSDLWRYAALVAGFAVIAGCVLWGALVVAHEEGWIDLSDRK